MYSAVLHVPNSTNCVFDYKVQIMVKFLLLDIMQFALCNHCKWSYHLWDEIGRTKILQKY